MSKATAIRYDRDGPWFCLRAPRGWWCSRGLHDGSCALRPYWWNLAWKLRYRRLLRELR